jgi:hypothetical protein
MYQGSLSFGYLLPTPIFQIVPVAIEEFDNREAQQ